MRIDTITCDDSHQERQGQWDRGSQLMYWITDSVWWGLANELAVWSSQSDLSFINDHGSSWTFIFPQSEEQFHFYSYESISIPLIGGKLLFAPIKDGPINFWQIYGLKLRH